jgi:hypothetical protein
MPSAAIVSAAPEFVEFSVLAETIEAANRDVHQSGNAIEKAEPYKVKLDEAKNRAQHQLGETGALAARVQVFGL